MLKCNPVPRPPPPLDVLCSNNREIIAALPQQAWRNHLTHRLVGASGAELVLCALQSIWQVRPNRDTVFCGAILFCWKIFSKPDTNFQTDHQFQSTLDAATPVIQCSLSLVLLGYGQALCPSVDKGRVGV